MKPLPELNQFCLDGIIEGRAKGKSYNIADAPIDHVMEGAEEIRDAINYFVGRLDRSPGPREREALMVVVLMLRGGVWRTLNIARAAQRKGE